MCKRGLMVLKFGGSVLQSPRDVHRAAQEVYRWRRLGYQVVAVVSAIGDSTDELANHVAAFGEGLDDHKVACLLATGERQSAALLGLALDRAGIPATVCDEVTAGLLTSGPPLDSRPVGLNTELLQRQLELHGVVVLPGFIGRDEDGKQTLLGRGGSDLTALFVACQLQARRCRLIKDVEGLYEFDPKLAEEHGNIAPRRYQHITWADALQLDESIVQHKGVRFARDRDLSFEVASIAAARNTIVGDFEKSQFAEPGDVAMRQLRVVLLGLGTVGRGVYEQLTELYHNDFELVAVAVRDLNKAQAAGVPENLLTNDPRTAINRDCDVVLELVGGEQLPRDWIESALRQGKHVVTANKALLAADKDALADVANRYSVTLSASAAVGGSVPMLEHVEQIRTASAVTGIAGILNGSCNFILDRIGEGTTFAQAVEEAREAGFTEADPSRDLAGIDAAEKLVLIARGCGYQITPGDIVTTPLTEELVDSIEWGPDEQLRQISRLQIGTESIKATVQIEKIGSESVFSEVRDAQNCLLIAGHASGQHKVSGVGAGRWPTTAAVLADLLDLHRDRWAQSTTSALTVDQFESSLIG